MILMPPKRILVVDDDASIRRLVATVLTREHYEVETASGGKDALSMILRAHYDVVVLDLMMPEVCGDDVLNVIAIRDPLIKCVVIMSAGSRQEIASAMTSNVFAALSKPFDIATLTATIRECLQACESDAPPVPIAA